MGRCQSCRRELNAEVELHRARTRQPTASLDPRYHVRVHVRAPIFFGTGQLEVVADIVGTGAVVLSRWLQVRRHSAMRS